MPPFYVHITAVHTGITFPARLVVFLSPDDALVKRGENNLSPGHAMITPAKDDEGAFATSKIKTPQTGERGGGGAITIVQAGDVR